MLNEVMGWATVGVAVEEVDDQGRQKGSYQRKRGIGEKQND